MIEQAEEMDLSPEDEELLDRINDEIGQKVARGEIVPLPPLPPLPEEDRVQRP